MYKLLIVIGGIALVASILTSAFYFSRLEMTDSIKQRGQWALIMVGVSILVLASGIYMNKNNQTTEKASSQETYSDQASNKNSGKEKALRILNQWANRNNDYGKVKFDEYGNIELILNDETANSDKETLKQIATEFGNKVRVQKSTTNAKLGKPSIYDQDNTPIAVWNGSTLELTD